MKILVVDDQALMRRGLILLLSTVDGVDVVGEAADGAEALARMRVLEPDVVLTDARMPGMDGIELVGRLRQEHPDVPAVILTTFDDEPLVREALAAGAAGFLLKDSSTEDLVSALTAAADGGLVIDPRVARAALSTRRKADVVSPLATLTRAERLVAAEVATGASNAEIAQRLVLAEGTVKNHVSHLLTKLDQRDRTGLALMLYRYLGQNGDQA